MEVSVIILLPFVFFHFLDHFELVVMLCSLFLELLSFLAGCLLLLVFHLSSLLILFELFFQFGVEFGNVDFFVVVGLTVHACCFEGLLELYFFCCFGLWFHLLIALSGCVGTYWLGR